MVEPFLNLTAFKPFGVQVLDTIINSFEIPDNPDTGYIFTYSSHIFDLWCIGIGIRDKRTPNLA
jgi:hypothetical protein